MRFLYVPGLISLIGIPILLLIFPIHAKQNSYSFRFYLPTEEMDSVGFSRYTIFRTIGNKKITSIDLSENESSPEMESTETKYFFNKRFNFINNEIERLAFTHDTSYVLKVTLGEENTLDDFVRLCNIAAIYRIKRYAYVDNDFYFFANPPPVPRPAPGDLDIISSDVPISIPVWRGPSFWDIQEGRLRDLVREIRFYLHGNYILSVGFILLIAVPAFSRIRRPVVQGIQPANKHVVL
jgi:hypothetical protein